MAFDFPRRHKAGDRGALSAADKAQNELSVRQGFRILSGVHVEDRSENLADNRGGQNFHVLAAPGGIKRKS
jgi:hypothetical protein